MTPASVRRFSRRRLEALINENMEVRRRLMAITANELLAARTRWCCLAQVRERKALLLPVEPVPEGGAARSERNRVGMPMGRADIADYWV